MDRSALRLRKLTRCQANAVQISSRASCWGTGYVKLLSTSRRRVRLCTLLSFSAHPIILVARALFASVLSLSCCSIPENISGEILKAVQSIYPMQNVYIRKVKALKKPKFDRECYNKLPPHRAARKVPFFPRRSVF